MSISATIRKPALWPLFTALLGMLVYLPVLWNDYNMDDELVSMNHRLTSRGLDAVPDILSEPYYSDEQGYRYGYRPVVHLSFALEHELFGESPFVSHLFNLLLYGLCCGLLLHCLRRLLENRIPTEWILLAALLFAVHPIHSEVVASIKNRDELLAFLFGLCSVLAAFRYAGAAWWSPWLLLLIGCMFLSVFSKASGLAFLLLIPMMLILLRQCSGIHLLLLGLGFAIIPFFGLSDNDLDIRLSASALTFLFPIAFGQLPGIHEQQLPAKLLDWVATKLRAASRMLKSTLTRIRLDFLWNWVFLLSIASVLMGLAIYGAYLEILPLAALLMLLSGFRCPELRKPLLFLIAGLQAAVLLLIFPNDFLMRPVFAALLGLAVLKAGKDRMIQLAAVFAWLGMIGWTQQFSLLGYLLVLLPLAFSPDESKWKWPLSGLFLAAISWPVIKHPEYWFSIPLLLPLLGWKLLPGKRRHMPVLVGMVMLIPLFMLWQQSFTNRVSWDFTAASSYTISPVEPPPGGIDSDAAKLIPSVDSGTAWSNRRFDYIENPLVGQTPWPVMIGTSLQVLARYVRMLLLPYPLSFYYGYAVIEPTDFSDPLSWIGLLLLLAIAGAIIHFLFRQPHISITLSILLLPLLLVSNGPVLIAGVMGERLAFLPSLGLCLLIPGVITFALEKWGKLPGYKRSTMLHLLAGMLILAGSGISFNRAFEWKDHFTLYKADIGHLEKSAQANMLLGNQYLKRAESAGRQGEMLNLFNKGVQHLEQSVRIHPGYFNAQVSLAYAYARKGETETAIATFHKVLELDSTFSSALRNIASIYKSTGQIDSSVHYFRRSIALKPDNSENQLQYILALAEWGRTDEALRQSERSVRQFADNWNFQMNHAILLMNAGLIANARPYVESAYRMAPEAERVLQVKYEFHRMMGEQSEMRSMEDILKARGLMNP